MLKARVAILFIFIILFSIYHYSISNKELLVNTNKIQSMNYYPYNYKGNIIPNFASVGYMEGTVNIPTFNTVYTISPIGNNNDDSIQIQKAIDDMSLLPLEQRGTILLNPGTYNIVNKIKITSSNIILKGTNKTNTILNLANEKYITLFNITSPNKVTYNGIKIPITDSYVPSGTKKINLDNVSNLKVGMSIYINKEVTGKWIKSLNMDQLIRNGQKQTWLQNGKVLQDERKIAAINNNEITLNIPLTDSLDKSYFNDIHIRPFTYDRIYNIGIQDLTITTYPYSGSLFEGGMSLLNTSGVIDSWIQNCNIVNFANGITLSSSKRMTLSKLHFKRTVKMEGGAKPADIFIRNSSQILITDCESDGNNNFSVITATTPGPNVVYNYKQNCPLMPHMRWATGLLVENVKGGRIEFINRRTMGSGHGWCIANSVIWNCDVQKLHIESPPGYTNLAIDSIGQDKKNDAGSIVYNNKTKFSLFNSQLHEYLKDTTKLPVILGKS